MKPDCERCGEVPADVTEDGLFGEEHSFCHACHVLELRDRRLRDEKK